MPSGLISRTRITFLELLSSKSLFEADGSIQTMMSMISLLGSPTVWFELHRRSTLEGELPAIAGPRLFLWICIQIHSLHTTRFLGGLQTKSILHKDS